MDVTESSSSVRTDADRAVRNACRHDEVGGKIWVLLDYRYVAYFSMTFGRRTELLPTIIGSSRGISEEFELGNYSS